MKATKISTLLDSILGVNYDLFFANATEVSNSLKTTLKKLKIDYKEYNSDDKESIEIRHWKKEQTPPKNIYEYQNFFLLKRKDGNTILLDGFRRLLWYPAQDINITFRQYNQEDLSDKQILSLLVSLNHTKFFGGIGEYFDRGFSLALKMIFGMEILRYKHVFHAYISNQKIGKLDFFQKAQDVTDEINERIITNKFVDDMLFVQDLLNQKVMMNYDFGVLLWNMRQQNPLAQFNAKFFIEKCKENKFITETQIKFEKLGTLRGAEAEKTSKRLIELYTNIFNEMLGKQSEQTFVEMNDAAKKMAQTLRKDKSLTKITGLKNFSEIEQVFFNAIKDSQKAVKVKVLVYPYDNTRSYSGERKESLPYGVYDFFVYQITQTTYWGGLRNDYELRNINEDVRITNDDYNQIHRIEDDKRFSSEYEYNYQKIEAYLTNEIVEDKLVKIKKVKE